jgi:hypothetical protein
MLRFISKRLPIWFKVVTSLSTIFAMSATAVLLASRQGRGPDIPSYAAMLSRVRKNGAIRVMVDFQIPSWPEGMPDDLRQVLAKSDEIQKAQDELLAELGSHQFTVLPVFWSIPLVSLEVDEASLLRLMNSKRVNSIVPYQDIDYYSPNVSYSTGNYAAPYNGGVQQPNLHGPTVP